MTATLDCRIKGEVIACRIAADADILSPVFCFSLMAPGRAVEGCEMVHSVGGYCEISLPEIRPGQPVDFVIGYKEHTPVNRAFLPLGPYLRHTGGITQMDAGPAGAKAWKYDGAAHEPALRLCPAPQSWAPFGGSVEVAGFAVENTEFAKVHDLSNRMNLGRFISADGVRTTVIQDPNLGAESYVLAISGDGIEVRAGDSAGEFYAAIALLNLTSTYAGQLPLGEITDGPRFGWRGQHLDCARHYFQPGSILQLIDLMAFQKLNRFHWHFSDDEAFRLEIDALPELWQQTRLRGEGHAIPSVFGGGTESGGSYSKEFVRELVDQARSLHIEVMPEIEIPAHALALNAVVPGMRDPEDQSGEVSVQGYSENTISPAMEKTWDVIGKLTKEVAELFPFEYMHIGCDEVPEGTWSGSPAAQALKDREGLETDDDLLGWMVAKVGRDLVAMGKRPAAWEEAARGANGGVGNGALLFSWTGQEPGIKAAKAGYDIVMCPAQNVYLDMAHTNAPDDWGTAWAAFVSLEDTVNWEPVPGELGQASARIAGVQGTFWGEFTTRDGEIINMIWPRILGVSTMGWSNGDGAWRRDFTQCARVYAKVMDNWRVETIKAMDA